MRCSACQDMIRPGLESAKRVEFWRQPDGSVAEFGFQARNGKLSEASGTLAEATHQKCYQIARKRVERGRDAGEGVLAAHPELAALLAG